MGMGMACWEWEGTILCKFPVFMLRPLQLSLSSGNPTGVRVLDTSDACRVSEGQHYGRRRSGTADQRQVDRRSSFNNSYVTAAIYC